MTHVVKFRRFVEKNCYQHAQLVNLYSFNNVDCICGDQSHRQPAVAVIQILNDTATE